MYGIKRIIIVYVITILYIFLFTIQAYTGVYRRYTSFSLEML